MALGSRTVGSASAVFGENQGLSLHLNHVSLASVMRLLVRFSLIVINLKIIVLPLLANKS